MNVSNGGLAILAIAAIWFLVFLPSFVKGDQAKLLQENAAQTKPSSFGTRNGMQAQAALRSRRTRNSLAGVALVLAGISGLAIAELLATGNGLPVVVGAAIGTAFFALLLIRANRNYRNLLNGFSKRSVPLVTPQLKKLEPAIATRNNSWSPEDLPKQIYLQTGAIEIVELAEVVSLDKPELENIDEILRRRRHVG